MTNKTKVIICDLDNTLALSDHRKLGSAEEYRKASFDEEYCRRILDDKVNEAVLKAVESIARNVTDIEDLYIIILSARLDTIYVRNYTTAWMNNHLNSRHSKVFGGFGCVCGCLEHIERTSTQLLLKPLDFTFSDEVYKGKMFAQVAEYCEVVMVLDDSIRHIERMMFENANGSGTVETKEFGVHDVWIRRKERLAPNCKFMWVNGSEIKEV